MPGRLRGGWTGLFWQSTRGKSTLLLRMPIVWFINYKMVNCIPIVYKIFNIKTTLKNEEMKRTQSDFGMAKMYSYIIVTVKWTLS